MFRIIFLGTSGQIPTEKRNHTSILIEVNYDCLLIDCGEGTQRQIKKVKYNANRISKILITHWHGDHTLGLMGLLESFNFNERNQDLYIYGPEGIKKFISSLFNTFNFKPNFKIIVNAVNGVFFEDENYILSSEKMTHSVPCNSYSITEKDELKINKNKIEKSGLNGPIIKRFKEGKDIVINKKIYSYKDFTSIKKGKKVSFIIDTSFNNKIIPFVRDSDLLVCESTFDKDLQDKAKKYFHLTINDVMNIVKKSNSKSLYVIHISQRYEKTLDFLIKYAKKNFSNSHFPNDFDEVTIK